jgi:hypothetical protein
MFDNLFRSGHKVGGHTVLPDAHLPETALNRQCVEEGAFVRGIDCRGKPCAGVVLFSRLACHHLELAIPGRTLLPVHANRNDIEVVSAEDLSAEELAFATTERQGIRALGKVHAYAASYRGCPIGH